ncbi:Dimeric dUTPase, all-alpha-NTP-PPase (MazG) superfamily [Pseudomonas sp. NFACC02]|uniref:dUTP diphosphatase n=1 Tax=Pseudomonas sp. NFACC02 TaxID=1566250 RepID=UPI0008D59501|nr:dUTP diphosphatase [Pseudomonas sp. NFACC02]SER57506.1 Dimeric dUTPase, all-alpha-NTP-PPase (MazG) superfamily [Pseudomonas sp. NFACC02]
MDRLALLQNQAKLMLHLQDTINSKINKEWRSARNPWYRAIWTECAELMDHVGWKWWKSQEVDIAQMKLELVDIWHFGLSELLASAYTESKVEALLASALSELDKGQKSYASAQSILDAIESFSLATLKSKSFDLPSFITLAAASNLSTSELFKSYVGKNILNRFRQDNGYKSGTYIKIWEGKEDNVWLSELIEKLSITSSDFSEELYNLLATTYKNKA